MTKIVNIFAGPGTGKSTTAAALFAECKYRGYNTEIIPEFAKDAAWEGRGDKFFKAQTYIFGCQSFRVSSVISEIDFAITDSPLLMSSVYIPDDYHAPSLKALISEHHNSHESINVFLKRNKPFNQNGRNQTEDEAKALDVTIRNLLIDNNVPYYELDYSRDNPIQILKLMADHGWIHFRTGSDFIITTAQRYEWIAKNPETFQKIVSLLAGMSGYDIQDQIDKCIEDLMYF
jgi:hypothetical protein